MGAQFDGVRLYSTVLRYPDNLRFGNRYIHLLIEALRWGGYLSYIGS